MFDKLDELVKKFAGFFLFPVVNLVIVTLIVYSITVAPDNASFSHFWKYIKDVLTPILSANGKVVSAFVDNYKNQLPAFASLVGAILTFGVIFVIYLIDRVVFYAGKSPPNLDFDLDPFVKTVMARRSKAIKALFGAVPPPLLYGAIRAYLGDKNNDRFRLAVRSRLVSNIEFAKMLSSYVKAYLIILGICYFGSRCLGIKVLGWNVFGALSVLAITYAVIIWYFSINFRKLVEYDFDSFVWESSYNDNIKMRLAPIVENEDVGLALFQRVLRFVHLTSVVESVSSWKTVRASLALWPAPGLDDTDLSYSGPALELHRA